jgi:hypothetical protein
MLSKSFILILLINQSIIHYNDVETIISFHLLSSDKRGNNENIHSHMAGDVSSHLPHTRRKSNDHEKFDFFSYWTPISSQMILSDTIANAMN